MTSTRGMRCVLLTRIRFTGFTMGCYTDGNVVALCTRWCEVDSNLTICSGMVCMGGCCTHCTGKTGFCTIRDGQVVWAERLLDSVRGATMISWGVWVVGCCILAAEYVVIQPWLMQCLFLFIRWCDKSSGLAATSIVSNTVMDTVFMTTMVIPVSVAMVFRASHGHARCHPL